MVKHFRGKIPPKCSWTFPGFIIPLEILAFESISVLKEHFREDVEDVEKNNESCRRMCKSRFIATGSTGYGLDVIYEKLGQTKEIINVLEPRGLELDLLWELFGERLWEDFKVRDDEDRDNMVVDGWNKLIFVDRVKILWENLYQMDVETRKKEDDLETVCEEPEAPRVCEETEAGGESLETRLIKRMKDELKVRDGKIAQPEARIKSMEDDRNSRDGFGNMDDYFDNSETFSWQQKEGGRLA